MTTDAAARSYEIEAEKHELEVYETRAQFWPYATLVIMIASLITAVALDDDKTGSGPSAAIVREQQGTTTKTMKSERFQIQKTTGETQAPSIIRLTVRISLLMFVTVTFIAAAVARRLRDRNKSGLFGIIPVFFLVFGIASVPTAVSQPAPNPIFFIAMAANWLLYFVSSGVLIVLLAGKNSQH